ncbi:MAG: BLUF domain-containing protein [Ekhidna sp.]|nr:BLUF domain-containing protein [Ekhidna sp.]
MIYYLIYTSTPTEPITQEMMENIIAASQKRNWKNGITGMLLGIEGKFLQYLEGGEEEVNDTFIRISKDARHKKINKWVAGFSTERIFSEWSMGSWILSNQELAQLTASKDIKEFLDDPVNEALQSKKFIAMMNNLLQTWIAHEAERQKKINDKLSK